MGQPCSKIPYSPNVFLVLLTDGTQPPAVFRLVASEHPYMTVRAISEDILAPCVIKPDPSADGKSWFIYENPEAGSRVGKITATQSGYAVRLGTQSFTVSLGAHPCHLQTPALNDGGLSFLKAILRRRIETSDSVMFTPEQVQLIQRTLPYVSFYHHTGDCNGVRVRYKCGLCTFKGFRLDSWRLLEAHLQGVHGLQVPLIARHFATIHCSECNSDIDLKEDISCQCPRDWCDEATRANLKTMSLTPDVADYFDYIATMKRDRHQVIDTTPRISVKYSPPTISAP